MKVSIIGGGGRVGSNAAFALQCAGVVAEIQILDANNDLAEGEALDLLHGSSASCPDNWYPVAQIVPCPFCDRGLGREYVRRFYGHLGSLCIVQ